MKVVVADTSPINYLVLIDCVEILRQLYGQIVIPQAVLNELTAEGAPPKLVAWIQAQPDWIEVRPNPSFNTFQFPATELNLDPGETAAIQLALAERDCLLLIDETSGRTVASRLGVANTGTLGVLVAAARAGWIDLPVALDSLRRTNFRVSQALIEKLLVEGK